MRNSSRQQQPKPQVAASGGPPRPPKKTASGLEDGSNEDPHKKLSAAEKAELARWLAERLKSVI
jgi:hypothetical protein